MYNPNEQMIDPMTGMPMQQTAVPPAPSNTLGNRTPMFMKDQTGDGKITRADVIKARVEGYKE